MQVWNVLYAAGWKIQYAKFAKNSTSAHHRTTLSGYSLSSWLRHVSAIGKSLLNSNISPTYPYNVVNFGPLAVEISWRVWGTPANFNGFCVLTALKRCSTVQKIVIEIVIEMCMEEIRLGLFQCNWFHCVDFRDWNRVWNRDWNRHGTNTAFSM